MSLQAQFDEFRQKIEPTDAQLKQVISSHTHLRQNVLQKLDYVSNTILTGSYKRATLIRPLNDVDVFAILSYSSPYHKDTPLPKTILQKLKNDLDNAYPTADPPKQDRPCVVLDFSHCKFEVTPAIEIPIVGTKNCRYYIPDINDLSYWKEIQDPYILGEQLTKANKENNDMLIPLIKMMKRCKQKHNLSIKSFKMEEIAIQTFSTITFSSYREGVERLLSAYKWYKIDDMIKIRKKNDIEFAKFCRETLFGNDFPN